MGVDHLSWSRMYPPAARPLDPIRQLAVAVVSQAVEDLHASQPLVRRDAARFFQGDAFDVWASLTPLDPSAVRARLVVLRLVDDDGCPCGPR